MNKRTVIAELNKIANELDNSGKFNEASAITSVMKRLAQFTPPVAAPVAAPVAPPVAAPVAAPVAPPFGAPVVPGMPAAPGAVPALGTPMQPAAPAAPVTNTTKAPFATSAGAQGNPTPQATNGDTANQMQAQNTMPAESPLYQQAINQIAGLLKTKNPMSRTQAQKIYEDTFVQLKDPKRKQAFANQFQRLVSQNFAAKYNQGPTQQ